MTTSRPTSAATLGVLLFVSGVAALVYQAVWIKQLTLVVGVDVYAVTTGVSGFFAGLAIGSALFGRLASRCREPLRLYACLELGIAALGVAATYGLAATPATFVHWQTAFGPVAWTLPFALVAAPACIMGGTLPPLLAALRPGRGETGRRAGGLYAANTAGAVTGALLTVFLVVPVFGIRGAAWFAASLNVLLAVAAWRAAGRVEFAVPERSEPAASGAGLALAVYATAGGIALGYEVVWTQMIVQFLSTRALAFSIVLATYLAGLVLGSWLYARFADRVRRPWRAFGVLIAAAGVAAMVTFALLGPWLPAAQDAFGRAVGAQTGSRSLDRAARFVLAAAVLILPGTLFLGAAFPAAARLIVRAGHAGRDVGLALALNIAGGIVGTVVTGFVLIPALGLAATLGALATVAALVGGVALIREGGLQARPLGVAATMIALVVTGGVVLPRDTLATLLADEHGGRVVFYDEGPGGTVAVIEQQAARGSFRRLYIQGVSNSGDVMPSQRYMRLQGLLPLLIHPDEPRSALVIAFGTGITAGSLLTWDGLERMAVVELLQPVIDAAPLFRGNFDAGRDPRLDVVIGDGRHELMRRDEQFDLITLEPPPPAAAGVVNLYSRDFYELARRRLAPDGLLAQWLPLNTQNIEDTRSLVRSVLDAFPHVTLWSTEFNETMLIGSMREVPLVFERIESRMAAPTVARALREVGVGSAGELLATYLTDRRGLEAFAGDAPAVTDDRPRIEYATWVRPREVRRALPALLELREAPPFRASPDEQRRIEAAHRRLREFYEISLLALAGDRDGWRRRVGSFTREGAPNAYYDWYFVAR